MIQLSKKKSQKQKSSLNLSKFYNINELNEIKNDLNGRKCNALNDIAMTIVSQLEQE